MVNIPWTIYRENKNAQYSDQWELVIYNTFEEMEAYNPSSVNERLKSYRVGGAMYNILSGKNLVFPQSRVKKISFPMPFAEFKTKDLPNKLNVYNEAVFDSRDVSITLIEDTDFSVFNYFDNWYKQIYSTATKQFMHDAETIYRYASVVFKTKNILLDAPSMRFNLHKLKLVGFDKNLDLNYEPGKPLEFTINMKVENVTTESYMN